MIHPGLFMDPNGDPSKVGEVLHDVVELVAVAADIVFEDNDHELVIP